ncbi:hypothetical protein PXK56_18340 [Phaeobacter gallaeciensis]|uniref:hypothetical protein n=1 Tax=Phaeobacter gallaeciensis TaxID=60890 RepID=UPI00238075C8|nr:hypothetical protein [Phaeobacter gallaeciensis]MDE4297147.1 hypothetical protein [Phaeobacter gallaeciensis]
MRKILTTAALIAFALPGTGRADATRSFSIALCGMISQVAGTAVTMRYSDIGVGDAIEKIDAVLEESLKDNPLKDAALEAAAQTIIQAYTLSWMSHPDNREAQQERFAAETLGECLAAFND